jgi:hypothetical protein
MELAGSVDALAEPDDLGLSVEIDQTTARFGLGDQ